MTLEMFRELDSALNAAIRLHGKHTDADEQLGDTWRRLWEMQGKLRAHWYLGQEWNAKREVAA